MLLNGTGRGAMPTLCVRDAYITCLSRSRGRIEGRGGRGGWVGIGTCRKKRLSARSGRVVHTVLRVQGLATLQLTLALPKSF